MSDEKTNILMADGDDLQAFRELFNNVTPEFDNPEHGTREYIMMTDAQVTMIHEASKALT